LSALVGIGCDAQLHYSQPQLYLDLRKPFRSQRVLAVPKLG
jgi:hypothetical protein